MWSRKVRSMEAHQLFFDENMDEESFQGEFLNTLCLEGNFQKVQQLLNKENFDGDVLMYAAVRCKNESIVEILMNKADSIGALAELGQLGMVDMVYEAAGFGNTKVFEYLLEKGLMIDQKDEDGQTPLFYAADTNNIPVVDMLIRKGNDVDIVDYSNRTPLHIASENGQKELVIKLLNAGSDVSKKDNEGKTAIFYAVEGNNIPVLAMFIEKEIDVNTHDNLGKTPLHIASANGQTEIVKKLLSACSDVNKKDNEGETPFFYAVVCHNAPVIDLLIEREIEVNTHDNFGRTPLHIASVNGNTEVVKKLLSKGSDVNKKDNEGKTPFFFAVERYNAPVIDLLIEENIDVNTRDNLNRTPLHIASRFGKTELVRKLLIAGSEVNCEDDAGETPIFYAAGKSYYFYRIPKRGLLDLSENKNPNFPDHLGVLKLLIERGAKINAKNKTGLSPIFCAIKNYQFHNVVFLLSAGARIDFPVDDSYSPFDKGDLNYEIEMKDVLKNHLIKLQAANMSVDESTVNKTFQLVAVESGSFKQSCSLEVEKMKIKWFGHVSLLDVLFKTEDPAFAKCSEIETFINSDKSTEEFPNYATLLKYKFRKAKKRINLLDFVFHNFNINLEGRIHEDPIPDVPKRKIFSYLTNKDLENIKSIYVRPVDNNQKS